MPENSPFSGPIKSTLNAMRFGENPFTCQCKTKREEKKSGRLNGLKFYSYWSFSNDIMAAKELTEAVFGLNENVFKAK